MSKFLVTAVDRKALGFDGSYRAGRFWPSATATEVEVLDQLQCPMVPAPDDPRRLIPDPNRLGRKAWAQVLADKQLSKQPADMVQVTTDGAEKIVELNHALAAATSELVEVGKANGDLQAKLADLETALAETRRQLQEAGIAKTNAETDLANLKIKNTELEQQLDIATAPKPPTPTKGKKG